MNQKVLLVIVAIVGLGVGLALGVVITNSKSKAAIADLQSKMQQSETASQQEISNYQSVANRLNNQLQMAKIEIEKLHSSVLAAQTAAAPAAENKKPAVASDADSVSGTTKLYTVKEGDSPWKIAASQLGNGDRCKEIIKLNPNVSPDGTNLTVGMKLKLPPK